MEKDEDDVKARVDEENEGEDDVKVKTEEEDKGEDDVKVKIEEEDEGEDDVKVTIDEEDEEEDDVKVTIEDLPVQRQQPKQIEQAQQLKKVLEDEAAQRIDLNTLNVDEKPWRQPGADISDYFNYGFDEETWKLYCDRQKGIKGSLEDIKNVHIQETYQIPIVGEMSRHMPVAPVLLPPPPPIIQQHAEPSSRSKSSRRRSRSRSDRRRSRSRSKSPARGSSRSTRRRRSRSREDERRSKRHKTRR